MMAQAPASAYSTPSLPPPMASMVFASAGAIENGRAPAILNTPRSFAAVLGFGRKSTDHKRQVDSEVTPETEPTGMDPRRPVKFRGRGSAWRYAASLTPS